MKVPRSLAWRLLIASALAYAPTLLGQVRDNPATAQTGPIIVTGRVTVGDEDAPLPRVRVGAQGDPQGPVLTDDDGRFQVIMSGDGGGLRLAKTGYAPLLVERRALRTGTQLSVRLARGGAINGTVLDSQGLAVPNVAVRVRRVTEGVQQPGGGAQGIAETDDLGEFRVGNLAAGRYSVQAAGLGGRGGGGGGRAGISDVVVEQLRTLEAQIGRDPQAGANMLRELADSAPPELRGLLDQAGRRGQGFGGQPGQGGQGGQAQGDPAAANNAGGRGRFGGNNGNGANGANGANGNAGQNPQANGAQANAAPANGTQANGAQGRGRQNTPQQTAAAGDQANGQAVNQNGGRRGGRGRGGAADPAAGQDLPTVEVKAGEDASITITAESPEAAILQIVTQLQRVTTTTTTQPTVNGTVRGRVLGSEGQPVKGASVLLNPFGATGTRRTAVSDVDGRYEITGVAVGSYRARVSKTGFPDIEYGQKRTLDAGRIITVSLNQRVDNINVTLPHPGAVYGAVMDRFGEPLEGASLQVLQARFVEGRTTLSTVSGIRARRTDDRGRYRLFGLLPGSYYVVASEADDQNDNGFGGPGGFGAPGGRGAQGNQGGRGAQGAQGGRGGRGGPGGPGGQQGDDNALRVFYPGALSAANATPVQIEVGQDAAGVDFTFSPGRVSKINGLAMSVSGQPSRGRVVLAVSQRSGEPMVPLRTARIEDDGTFVFENVAAGDYVVQVISNGINGGAGGRGGADTAGRGRGGQGGGQGGGQNGQGGAGGRGAGNGNAATPQRGAAGAGGGGIAGAAGIGGQAGQTAGGQARGGAGAAGGARQGAGQTAAGGGATGGRGAGAQAGGAAGAAQGRGQAAQQLARLTRAVNDREFGMAYITVNEGETASVRIDSGPGIPVAGQIALEGDVSTATVASFGLTANAANADTSPLSGTRTSRATINDDGTFQFEDLMGAVRFVSARAPDGWWLKSVTINGVNGVLDPITFSRGDSALTSVTAVFASGAGTIGGTVLDDRRQPTGDFGVVIFSPNPDRWFSQSPYLHFGSPAQDGTFTVSGLPPDEYLVAALDRIDGGQDFGDWQNPAVLTALSASAKRVKVSAGQTVSTELRMLRAAR